MNPSIIRVFAGIVIALALLPAGVLFLNGLPGWFVWPLFWVCLLVLSLSRAMPLAIRGLLLICVAALCSGITPAFVSTLPEQSVMLRGFVARMGDIILFVGSGVGGNFIAATLLAAEAQRRGA